MPPKKKIIKKIVRKVKRKTPTPLIEPESEPESTPTTATPETPAADTAETPVPEDTKPASEETLAPEPTANETLAPEQATEPTANETLAPEPATEPTAIETLAPEPGSELTASTETIETPAEEPAATETTQEPLEAATRQKKKIVKKVLVKKIVKKLVPKSTPSSAAKEEQRAVQEAQLEEAAPVEAPKLDDQPVVENPKGEVPETVLEAAVLDSNKTDDVLEEEKKEDVVEEESGISGRSNRRKTEIFIGGLDRDTKEEDLRKVFGKVGEIVEVRMIMDGQSGKNKGYAFLRYAEASQAKNAVTEFGKVEVCGKLCGASALKGNNTIFIGNIDKKWKKGDVIKLLQKIGIEKIETVTVMTDPNNADSNRGFAFLELETDKDAQSAYKKLQKKDAFGKGRNIKVAWAEPMNDPGEEEMKKVKSVYVEGVPSSWNEEKVEESFKKFGEIERIVLSRNIKSARRKDFAFVNYKTREAALLCIESFDKELIDNCSKVNVKVSLAKPVQKSKQNKGGSKFSDKDNIKEKSKSVQRDTKANISLSVGKSFKGSHTSSVDKKSSTTHELLHVLREQETWRQGQRGYPGGSTLHDYTHGVGVKRPFSALGDEALYSDLRGYPRTRLDSSYPPASSSFGAMPLGMVGSSHPHYQQHQGVGNAAGSVCGSTGYADTHEVRQGAPPFGNSYYSRY